MGLANASLPGLQWTVSELYPHSGAGLGIWNAGDAVLVPVAGSAARVLWLQRLPKNPALFVANASGLAAFDAASNVLTVSNLTNDVGSTAKVHVWFVPTCPRTVVVNGQTVNAACGTSPLYPGVIVSLQVTFAGQPFTAMQPVGSLAAAAAFKGPGWLNATLLVPARIATQLASLTAAYPVPWTAADTQTSWLAPARLLLEVHFAQPSDAWSLDVYVDGQPAPVSRSYNSRALAESGCFLGFYVDLSSVPGLIVFNRTQTVSLYVQDPTAMGNLLGVFVGNVVNAYTSDLMP